VPPTEEPQQLPMRRRAVIVIVPSLLVALWQRCGSDVFVDGNHTRSGLDARLWSLCDGARLLACLLNTATI